MIQLNLIRQYESDTLFQAVNIMDRYLMLTGLPDFRVEDLNVLACTSLLIAAKLEQPHIPNYANMVLAYKQVRTQGDRMVTRADLKLMEQRVLVRLGFDFSFCSPRHFLDRFARVCKDHCTDEIK